MTALQQDPKLPATLIPGDGIGPEITDAAVVILEAAGVARRLSVFAAHDAG